jgi:hypothetical protein
MARSSDFKGIADVSAAAGAGRSGAEAPESPLFDASSF